MSHNNETANIYARAIALGVVAGLRSPLPLALLALAANQGSFGAHSGPPLGLLRSRAALGVLGLSAGGELIADKLPIVPNRNELGPLAGRVVIGGTVGAALTHEVGRPALSGALLGGIGAVVAANGAYYARVWLGRVTGVPDPVWGGVEDVLAVALGLLAVRQTGNLVRSRVESHGA